MGYTKKLFKIYKVTSNAGSTRISLVLRFKNQGLKMIALTRTSLMHINWRMLSGVGSTQVAYAFVIPGSIRAILKVTEVWIEHKNRGNN